MLLHNNKNKRLNSKRIKTIFLLFLISISLISTLPIFQTTKVSAVNRFDSNTTNLKWQAQSFQYYKALSACMESNQTSGTIPASKAAEGGWFAKWDGNSVGVGVFMKDAFSGVNEKGVANCGDPNFINSAMDFWGLDKIEVLCNSGIKREHQSGTGSDGELMCLDKNSNDPFKINENEGSKQASKFRAYIRQTVYGQGRDNDSEISLTDPALYIFYLHTLGQSCISQIESTKPDLAKKDESDKKAYNNVSWVDMSTDPPALSNGGSYAGTLERDNKIGYDFNEVGIYKSVKEDSCVAIKDKMNSYASAFNDWALIHKKEAKDAIGSDSSSSSGKDAPTCDSQMKLLGWIICPIVEGLSHLNDMMFNLIESLLTVNPLSQASTDNTFLAWGSIRNIANAAFVIVFLIIIFSQMSGAGITNYGIKKLLPKLIICAILVNLSYVIMQVLVDLANITGSSLYWILKNLAPHNNDLTWYALFNLLIAGGLGAAGVGVAAAAFGAPTLIFMFLPIVLMGGLALIVAFATLVFRQAAIPILAILSPLAFVAYLLPNTESWFKKWKDMLVSMLMLYPIAALVFGGCYFASSSMIGDGKDWWKLMIGLVVLVLPLFSLPFLAKQGGAILSKVNGAVSGVADKFKKPINDFGSKHADSAKEKYLATPAQDWNFGKRARLGIQRRSRRRDIQSASYKKQNEDAFTQDLRDDPDYYKKGMNTKGRDDFAIKNIDDTVMGLESKQLEAAKTLAVKDMARNRTTGGDDKSFIGNKALGLMIDPTTGNTVADPNSTLLDRKVGYALAGQLKMDGVIRQALDANTAVTGVGGVGGDSADTLARKGMNTALIQEAISSNASTLMGKAPDLVKGTTAMYGNLTGDILAGLSKDAMPVMLNELNRLQVNAAAPGATAEQTSDYNTAIAAFSSSVNDIKANSELRSKFEGPQGEVLINYVENRDAAGTIGAGTNNTDLIWDIRPGVALVDAGDHRIHA